MEVGIVIPFYRNQELLRDCLMSLLATTDVTGERIVVVDDSATERDEIDCQRIADVMCVKYFRNDHARPGYISATRMGAEYLLPQLGEENYRDTAVLFLDSDTKALGAGWLGKMLLVLQNNPTVDVVGAKLLFPDSHPLQFAGKIQHAGIARAAGGRIFYPFQREDANLPQANSFHADLNAVTGACMLVRGDAWKVLGGWDDNLSPGGLQDVDFCWRVKDLGRQVVYEPTAELSHFQAGSTDSNGVHAIYSRLAQREAYMASKWRGIEGDEHLFWAGPTSGPRSWVGARQDWRDKVLHRSAFQQCWRAPATHVRIGRTRQPGGGDVGTEYGRNPRPKGAR